MRGSRAPRRTQPYSPAAAARWFRWKKSRSTKALSLSAGSSYRVDRQRIGRQRSAVEGRDRRAHRNLGARSFRNLRDAQRIKALQELARVLCVESCIAGFDAEKKSILRRAFELRNVKQRVIRPRQTVERKRSKECSERRRQHGQFKGD